MDEKPQSRFRERRKAVDGGGLTREESPRGPRPAGLDLITDKITDIAESAGLRLVPLADQLMPVGVGDIDTIASDGDFGIASLVAEQRSERLTALLERVQALFAAGEWRSALSVIQQARAIDPVSAHAMVLQVQCLMELGHHEPALRIVAYAREQITDPDIRSFLLRLEAACVRATTKTLEARLVELVEAGQVEDGLALIQEGLRRQPSNIVFLYHLASLHWRRADVAAARRAIDEARRHMGRESLDLIADLERAIEFGEQRTAVEAARQSLRRGEATTALAALESCADTLAGNEHYDALCDYARERRPAAFARLRSAPVADVGSASRQQTLRWVLSEEIREGDEALNAGRYEHAQAVFARADGIDARCGAVCYKHAQALYLKHKNRKGRAPMDGAAEHDLAYAQDLARRASVDSGYAEVADALLARIAQWRSGGLELR